MFAQLMQSRMIQVSPGGRLSRFLGKDEASLQQLIDVGLRNDDAALRTEALRMAIQAIDGQPDLNAATITAIEAMDDNQLMALFRATYVDVAGVVLCVVMMSISGLFYIIGGQYLVGKLWNLVPISGYDGGLSAAKARILLMVLLGAGWDRTRIREAFEGAPTPAPPEC